MVDSRCLGGQAAVLAAGHGGFAIAPVGRGRLCLGRTYELVIREVAVACNKRWAKANPILPTATVWIGVLAPHTEPGVT